MNCNTHENILRQSIKEMSYRTVLFFICVVEPYNPDNRTRAFKDAPIGRRGFTGGKQAEI
jgi:hypothetical protein